MVRGLYWSMIEEKRAVGYCKFHHCHITAPQIKQKECLKKQCNHLERREHEFWRLRQREKMKRKNARKARLGL